MFDACDAVSARQRSRQLASAAELWARSALLRRCLLRWRHHRALLAREREEAARHWHRTRLAAWGPHQVENGESRAVRAESQR